MCKFSKSCLMVFLMVFIVSSSLSALAFLPSYSTGSEGRGTGLLSILQSVTPEKSEQSSTAEGEDEPALLPTRPEGKVKDGYVCYTEKEVKEMDNALAKVEKTLTDELKPFHFGLGASIGYKPFTVLSPELDMQLRWNNFILNGGVSYDFDWTVAPEDITFKPENLGAKVGFMYEW